MPESPKKYALLSVSDKTGLIKLGDGLLKLEYDLISTSGTARAIADAGLPVTEVSDLTGFPEILGGRVKTLHPFISGGVLAQRDLPRDVAEMAEHGIPDIQIVAVNLYDFPSNPSVDTIDIGGHTLLRAAAKNWRSVIPICDREDYDFVLANLRNGPLSIHVRQHLAKEAFSETRAYDEAVERWFMDQIVEAKRAKDD